MPLNENEKAACRYYLGYMGVGTSFGISLGLPDKTQLNFILEGNMNNLLFSAERFVRRCIRDLLCIEDQLSSTRLGVDVKRVTGSVEFRKREAFEDLDDQMEYWTGKLSQTLGAPPNPFSNVVAGSAVQGVVEPS